MIYFEGQVALGVAYRASRDRTRNGVILHAADGRFSLMNVQSSDSLELGGASLTPEAVGDWLDTAASP